MNPGDPTHRKFFGWSERWRRSGLRERRRRPRDRSRKSTLGVPAGIRKEADLRRAALQNWQSTGGIPASLWWDG